MVNVVGGILFQGGERWPGPSSPLILVKNGVTCIGPNTRKGLEHIPYEEALESPETL